MATIIKTMNLNKIYEGSFRGQDVHALRDLTLEIPEGEIFGYLGPNGSGKTTTIKMLLGLIFPTSGSIEILGSKAISASAVKQNIGYLPEGAYYPDFLRGEEILAYYGKLYGLGGADLKKRINESLEMVGMERARKRLLRGYSKGMRQRIGLAQALISDPKILILDEPTTGLDPIARKEIRDILIELRDPRERDLPVMGPVTLRDVESGRRVMVDTADPKFRERFRQISEERDRERRGMFRRLGARHLIASTDSDWVLPLTLALRRPSPSRRAL